MTKYLIMYYDVKLAEILAPNYKDAVIQMGVRFGGMIGLSLIQVQ